MSDQQKPSAADFCLRGAGEDIRTMIEDLNSVNIDWKTGCTNAAIEASKNYVRETHLASTAAISRTKRARKGIYHAVYAGGDLVEFARTVGAAYIVYCQNTNIDTPGVWNALVPEDLRKEYAVMGHGENWALVHRHAPPSGESEIVLTKASFHSVKVACLALGFKTVTFQTCGVTSRVLMAPDWRQVVVSAYSTQRAFDDVDAALRDTEAMLERYVFHAAGDTCVGVRRDLFAKSDPKIGIVSASYPKETMAAINAGAKYIITDDATWGRIVLDEENTSTVAGSLTAACIISLRTAYVVVPDKNAGGVICIRRT